MGGGQEDLPPSIIATFQGGLNQHPHCIRHWVPFLYWFNQKWEYNKREEEKIMKNYRGVNCNIKTELLRAGTREKKEKNTNIEKKWKCKKQ